MTGLTKCLGCGSPIKWIHTKNGKHMPCDPERKIISNLKTGNDTFILLNGETVRGDEAGTIISDTLDDYLVGYSPHWINCPEAKIFKAKK